MMNMDRQAGLIGCGGAGRRISARVPIEHRDWISCEVELRLTARSGE
jgi:hypothetical protein